LQRIAPAQVLLICGDTDRGYIYQGKRYAQLLDSINERLSENGIETLTIADPFAKVYGALAFGKVYSINGLIARANLKYTILRKIKGDFTIHDNPVVKAWTRVIAKANPQIIIGIQPSSELCIAACSDNVWIADLQHGILSDEGYYGVKKRAILNDQGWPSSILCWDQASSEWLKEKLGSRVESRIIGNPWFLRFLNPSISDNLVQNAIKLVYKVSNEPVILVTLQWGVKRTSENHEIGIPMALLNYIKKNNKGVIWWLRIHPVQLQGQKGKVFLQKIGREFEGHNNVLWKMPSKHPIPLILKGVDLHITIQSAVTIESAWFGIKTALLHPSPDLMYEYFKEQLDGEMAEIVIASETDIKQWIDRQLKELKDKNTIPELNETLINEFISDIRDGKYNKNLKN
jgi:hypothetical protein